MTALMFEMHYNVLLYVHRERSDLRGAKFTLSVCLGHKLYVTL